MFQSVRMSKINLLRSLQSMVDQRLARMTVALKGKNSATQNKMVHTTRHSGLAYNSRMKRTDRRTIIKLSPNHGPKVSWDAITGVK